MSVENPLKSGRALLLQSAAVFLLSSSLAFAQSPGLGNEDDPDLPSPGFVQNTDEAVTPEIQAEMLVEQGTFVDTDTAAALNSWKLSDYQGAQISTETGEMVGTVEKIGYDDGQTVYLIVQPSAEMAAAGETPRLVRLNQVRYDSTSQGLRLDSTTAASVDALPPYDEAQGDFMTEITTDAQLGEFTGSSLQGSSEINAN